MKRINFMEVNHGIVMNLVAVLILLALLVSAASQANAQEQRGSMVSGTTIQGARQAETIESGTISMDQDASKVSLPPNVILSEQTKLLVEKVWRRSPTFRVQCERIAQAQWLRVKIKFAPKSSPVLKYRALTIVNKQSGLATIKIYMPNDFVELIGHEFEHVLEQIEGVNLARLVAENNGQAQSPESGVFETVRALKAGRKVKAEYSRAKSSGFSTDIAL